MMNVQGSRQEPQPRDIDLVLVTGAGASREFGNPHHGGSPVLPLMPEWSDSLVTALATAPGYPSLHELVGLDKGLDGPQFEQHLGEFLALAEYFPDLERVLSPSLRSSLNLSLPGLNDEVLKRWHSSTKMLIEAAVGIIYQSLTDNFGWERINPDGALTAYRDLFRALGISDQHRLVYATTNYDLMAESVLDGLGRRPDPGIRPQRYAGPGVHTGERLDMINLVDAVGRYTPLLHLHGAIGWFDQPGIGPTVINAKYDPAWGVPLTMLPSLQKDYQQSGTIATIWSEFRKALRRARRVLVLGHSLNDMELSRALLEEVEPLERIAITHLPDCPFDFPPSVAPMWAARSAPTLIPLQFGRATDWNVSELLSWKAID